MNDIEKLRHLLEHWAEHNSEHADTYAEWSKKAEALGKPELAGILKEIAYETMKINKLLEKAKGMA